MWAHGRLGLGVTPIARVRGSRRSTQKAARYKMRPGFIDGITNAVSVRCGEAHTMLLTKGGDVMTWGQNSCGQLGTGPTPSGFLIDALTPVYVEPFAPPVHGPQGSAHHSRTAVEPEVGAGAADKGDTDEVATEDEDESVATASSAEPPKRRLIPSRGTLRMPRPRVRARQIAAGSYHSLVIDEEGKLWTWGARGHGCLGHADAALEGVWGNRASAIFSITTENIKIMVPYELLSWCKRWSTPRPVQALHDVAVAQVSTGVMHTAVVSTSGHLYLMGGAPVVPAFVSTANLLDAEASMRSERQAKREDAAEFDDDDDGDGDGDDDDDEGGVDDSEDGDAADDDNNGARQLKKKGRRKRLDGADEQEEGEALAARERVLMDLAVQVSIPRRPSVSWLSALSSRRTVYTAGAGTRLFVLQDEEMIAYSLGGPLLRRLLAPATVSSSGSVSSSEDKPDILPSIQAALDDLSLDSHSRSDSGSVSSYFAVRGKADCMLVASGKVLLGHRGILAHRSSELRDMIDMEVAPDEDTNLLQPISVLIPHLQAEAAKAFVYFLYTDALPPACSTNAQLLGALQHTGVIMHMPRLQLLAECLLNLLIKMRLNIPQIEEEDNDDDSDDDEQGGGGWGSRRNVVAPLELPPFTLARDLGALVGDAQHADVRFIAEGRTLAAHRFVLESRCEYFRAMFRSGRRGMIGGMSEDEDGAIIDVVVPDTFIGFLRLLIFLYTDTLPDGSDGALLEDLMSADRYRIADLRTLCESMLAPNKDNWLDLLRVADLVGSHHLHAQAVSFLRDNFSVLSAPGSQDPLEGERENGPEERSLLNELNEEFPGLLGQLLDLRHEAYPLPPSQVIISQMKSNVEAEKTANDPKFPWMALIVLPCAYALYTFSANLVLLGPAVPIFNVAFLVGGAYYLIVHSK